MIDTMIQNPLRRWFGGGPGAGKPRRTVLVKQLEERDRRRILKHFLGLDDSDRLLRFGTVLPDEQLEAYVARIDFRRDTVYGVYNRVFKLVAVGHLAFAPKEKVAQGRVATEKDKVAEFGVSVSRSARGLGIGSKLFERAAIHCRNSDVDTLYMHCLASNQTMIHIAKKAGMEIQREYGEADAYLRLLPPNPASMLQEALEEQFATIDYTLKANTRAAVKFFEEKK
jgi:GNAT superfamily N-acetyltransferase